MKYSKCPRCELNYITNDQTICKVCRDQLERKTTEEETELELCPLCYKHLIDKNEIMCKRCEAKRTKPDPTEAE